MALDATAPRRAGKRRSPRREISAGAFAALMYLPTLVCLALVLAYPVLYAGYLSLHRVGLGQLRRGEFPFVGLENYARLFDDRLFWVALKNTFLFTGVTVVAEVVLGVAIALLINQTGIWTSRVTRLLILLPYAVPPIANGLIWSFIYSFQFGFLNRMLFSLGLIDAPINWSGNPGDALYAVTVPYIWRTLPFAILLVHAALQGIPRELHEAAAVDGATAWRRFWHITLPLTPADHRHYSHPAHLVRVCGVRGNSGDHAGWPGRCDLGCCLVQLQDLVCPAQQLRRRLRIGLCPGAPDRSPRDRLCAFRLPPGDALMFKQSPFVRTLLHLANLLVIAFFLLPLFAVAIGSIQSERSLQADTRAVFPREVTLDNFLVILSKGEQKGRIFEQVTYLPENIKQFFLIGHCSIPPSSQFP